MCNSVQKNLSITHQMCSESHIRHQSIEHRSYIHDFKVRQTNWDSNPGLMPSPGVVVRIK